MQLLIETYISFIHWLITYFVSILVAVAVGWSAVGITGAIAESAVTISFDKSIVILLLFSMGFAAILALPVALIFEALPELIGFQPRRVFLVPAGVLAGYFVFFAIVVWDAPTLVSGLEILPGFHRRLSWLDLWILVSGAAGGYTFGSLRQKFHYDRHAVKGEQNT